VQKARFIFTGYKNSFKVFVKNLESLSVSQIQEIQKFVEARKGIFDFTTYTFVIQKRLEFEEFVKVIDLLPINAIVTNDPVKEIQKDRVGFGQYKGMYYSELPDSYLVWLQSNYHGPDKELIDSELKRRKP